MPKPGESSPKARKAARRTKSSTVRINAALFATFIPVWCLLLYYLTGPIGTWWLVMTLLLLVALVPLAGIVIIWDLVVHLEMLDALTLLELPPHKFAIGCALSLGFVALYSCW